VFKGIGGAGVTAYVGEADEKEIGEWKVMIENILYSLNLNIIPFQ